MLQNELSNLWRDANINHNYQRIIARRKKLHRVTKELYSIFGPCVKKNDHIFEIGCGSGRNLSYILNRHSKVKVSGSDLVKESCFSNMDEYLQRKITFYESDTCKFVNSNVIECDICLIIDHLMHLSIECAQSVLMSVMNTWKPRMIVLRNSTTTRDSFPCIFVHDIEILKEKYNFIFDGRSARDKNYRIILAERYEHMQK